MELGDDAAVVDAKRLHQYFSHQSAPISHVRSVDVNSLVAEGLQFSQGPKQSTQSLEQVGLLRELSNGELRRLADGKKISGSFLELKGYADVPTIYRVLDASDARIALRARISQLQQDIEGFVRGIECQKQRARIHGRGATVDELSVVETREIVEKTVEELFRAQSLAGDDPALHARRSIMLNVKRIRNHNFEIKWIEQLVIELGDPSAEFPIDERRRRRSAIAESVRHEVWRRDEGRCTVCGSQLNLEFDHIIPFAKGGSNTARNLQLLCQICNSKKSAQI